MHFTSTTVKFLLWFALRSSNVESETRQSECLMRLDFFIHFIHQLVLDNECVCCYDWLRSQLQANRNVVLTMTIKSTWNTGHLDHDVIVLMKILKKMHSNAFVNASKYCISYVQYDGSASFRQPNYQWLYIQTTVTL